jgi:hypothetical protein
MDQIGFVSMSYLFQRDTTLFLWCKERNDQKHTMEWRVQAMINVPLSSRIRPRVHYDGRRLVVFGRDHIGFIVLVYQVWNRPQLVASSPNAPHLVGDSGGVRLVSLDQSLYVSFANRIRHAALGGMNELDPIHMTCNERYLILSTKMGNCLYSDVASSSTFSDGMLIIDLEQPWNDGATEDTMEAL